MKRKSISGYTDDWPAVALRVKNEAGWKCVRCGHEHDPASGYCLTVHHLTIDPANNRWWNTAALCQRCHLSIQSKVIMERVWMFEHTDWFKPYAAGYYAFVNGEDDSRDYVIANLERLLDYGRVKL